MLLDELIFQLRTSYPVLDLEAGLCDNILHINSITVKEGHRNHGVGTAIMNSIISWSKEENLDEIVLISSPKARKFYPKFGFTKERGLLCLYRLKLNVE
jgi:GNAT superfamily N-acetyltransferase